MVKRSTTMMAMRTMWTMLMEKPKDEIQYAKGVQNDVVNTIELVCSASSERNVYTFISFIY